MKKSIVLAVIGLAAGVTTTFSQGLAYFDSYYLDIPINGVAPGFTAALVYSLTPMTDSAGNGAINPGFSTAYQSPDSSNPANGLMTASFFDSDGAYYFFGHGNSLYFELPSYTGSANVYFEVLAYNGASYDTSTIRGHSAAFGTPLATGANSPVYLPFASFAVSAVPEPTTLALGGLGLAALFLFRRKQA